MGIAFGLIAGTLAYFCLGRSTRALLAGDFTRAAIAFALNAAAIALPLFACAWLRPGQIAHAGIALAAALVGGALIQFTWMHLRSRSSAHKKTQAKGEGDIEGD